MKIAILYICTGKYNQFFNGFYESAEKYFFKGVAQKDYFVFTDDMSLTIAENVHLFERRCQGFPLDSLFRFEIFLTVKDSIKEYDYVYFFNANAMFVRETNEELLPAEDAGLIAGTWKMRLKHPMFYPYERNKKSTAYIPPKDGPYRYYGGFFNGGNTDDYLKMVEQLANNTRTDYENGIIARVHDESHLNCYLHNNSCTALPEEFIIPEELLSSSDNPYIILRDKVKIDPYFDKGRKHNLSAVLKKIFDKYIKSAVIWYL